MLHFSLFQSFIFLKNFTIDLLICEENVLSKGRHKNQERISRGIQGHLKVSLGLALPIDSRPCRRPVLNGYTTISGVAIHRVGGQEPSTPLVPWIHHAVRFCWKRTGKIVSQSGQRLRRSQPDAAARKKSAAAAKKRLLLSRRRLLLLQTQLHTIYTAAVVMKTAATDSKTADTTKKQLLLLLLSKLLPWRQLLRLRLRLPVRLRLPLLQIEEWLLFISFAAITINTIWEVGKSFPLLVQ
jgi:hypothetical protein